jgi:RNA polymerase sigma-70 factor (ECF subfamily)
MQSGDATRIMPIRIEIHGSGHGRGTRRPAVGLDPAIGFLDRLEAPTGDSAREWERDHDYQVFGRLLAIVHPDLRPTTWEAFRRFALDGLPTAKVTADLPTFRGRSGALGAFHGSFG